MSMTYTIKFDEADFPVTHRYVAWSVNGENLNAEPLMANESETVYHISVEEGDVVEVVGKNVIQFTNEFGNMESIYSDPAVITFTAVKRPEAPVAPVIELEVPPVEIV